MPPQMDNHNTFKLFYIMALISIAGISCMWFAMLWWHNELVNFIIVAMLTFGLKPTYHATSKSPRRIREIQRTCLLISYLVTVLVWAHAGPLNHPHL